MQSPHYLGTLLGFRRENTSQGRRELDMVPSLLPTSCVPSDKLVKLSGLWPLFRVVESFPAFMLLVSVPSFRLGQHLSGQCYSELSRKLHPQRKFRNLP